MSLAGVNIHELAAFIKQCEKAGGPKSKAEATKLGKARLKMACWVCRAEGIEPNVENIAGILGRDFKSTVQFMKEVQVELGSDGPIL